LSGSVSHTLTAAVRKGRGRAAQALPVKVYNTIRSHVTKAGTKMPDAFGPNTRAWSICQKRWPSHPLQVHPRLNPAQVSVNKHVCLHRDALDAPPGRQAATDARGTRWDGGCARGGRRQPRIARAPPCRPGGPRRDGRLQDLVGAPPEQVEVHAPRRQQRAAAVVLQLVWDGHHLRGDPVRVKTYGMATSRAG